MISQAISSLPLPTDGSISCKGVKTFTSDKAGSVLLGSGKLLGLKSLVVSPGSTSNLMTPLEPT